MNKQELIDKAVELNEGLFPGIGDSFRFGHNACDIYRGEFEKRSRELGWINGYKYGVEYETNGKMPDLLDDVFVHVNFRDGEKREGALWLWDWHSSKSFRIVDERYKPVKAEQVQDEKPKKDLSDAIFAMLDAVNALTDAGEIEYARQLKGAAGVMQAKQRQKLSDEGKRRFVEAMSGKNVGGYVITDTAARDMYDAGCRFTESKAAS